MNGFLHLITMGADDGEEVTAVPLRTTTASNLTSYVFYQKSGLEESLISFPPGQNLILPQVIGSRMVTTSIQTSAYSH